MSPAAFQARALDENGHMLRDDKGPAILAEHWKWSQVMLQNFTQSFSAQSMTCEWLSATTTWDFSPVSVKLIVLQPFLCLLRMSTGP